MSKFNIGNLSLGIHLTFEIGNLTFNIVPYQRLKNHSS